MLSCIFSQDVVQITLGVDMFFINWSGLARVAVATICTYPALILFLRISGKRTLSKMNAFDFVVTIALGSTLATVILSRDTSIAEGLVALSLLILLQFTITWLSVRSRAVNRLVKSEPRLLFRRGVFLRSAMRAERVNEEEILHAIRSEGIKATDEIEAVVLESDGSLSVVGMKNEGRATALSDVKGA